MMNESAIKGLLAFLKVVEHGSINKAARDMKVSQPALTRTLQQFEAVVGAPVLIREAKGVIPSRLGEMLLSHAKSIRSEAANATRAIEQFRLQKRRQISIGTVTALPLAHFTDAILQFTNDESDLFIRVIHGTLEELLALLDEGRIEMAFGPLLDSAIGHRIIQDVIYYDELALYSSATASIAKLTAIKLSDLQGVPWVLPPVGVTARDKVFELFNNASLPLPHLPIEVENVPMRRAIVLRSQFVSAFHAHHVHQEVESGGLVRLNFDWTSHLGPIGSMRLTPHNQISRKLIDVFKARYLAAGFPTKAH